MGYRLADPVDGFLDGDTYIEYDEAIRRAIEESFNDRVIAVCNTDDEEFDPNDTIVALVFQQKVYTKHP